jgi:hypothetical protein
VEGLKLVARSHQAFIWDRTRHLQRLRSSLREFFPAALEAFPDLMAAEALELLERAPDPARAARLSRSKITAALIRAHRRDPEGRAEAIQALLRAPALRQDPAIEAAYAVIVASAVRLIAQLNTQLVEFQAVVAEGFGRHPDAEIVTNQPGLGPVLGGRAPGCSPSSATTLTAILKRYALLQGRADWTGLPGVTDDLLQPVGDTGVRAGPPPSWDGGVRDHVGELARNAYSGCPGSADWCRRSTKPPRESRLSAGMTSREATNLTTGSVQKTRRTATACWRTCLSADVSVSRRAAARRRPCPGVRPFPGGRVEGQFLEEEGLP